MMPLVDVTEKWKGLEGKDLVCRITGNMTYFPLCCSTGVLQNVGARQINKTVDKPTLENPTSYSVFSTDIYKKVKAAKYIFEIIKYIPTNACYPFPKEVAGWNALSLVLAKCVDGTDRHGPGTYSGYKAAQITMFDRTQEDKDPKKKFNFTYNMTYSIDHFIMWLNQHPDFGELLISTPKPGGHGAKVYGAIFTPDISEVQKFHDSKLKLVRNQVLLANKYYSKDKNIQKTQLKGPALQW